MTRPYARVGAPPGHPGDAFVHSLLLVVVNRLAAVAVAVGAAAALRDWSVFFPVAPFREYGAVSLFNVVATSCQYEALRWIPFPTLSVGKCTKIVAVMAVLRIRAGGPLYSGADVAAGLAIAAGAGVVLATSPSSPASAMAVVVKVTEAAVAGEGVSGQVKAAAAAASAAAVGAATVAADGALSPASTQGAATAGAAAAAAASMAAPAAAARVATVGDVAAAAAYGGLWAAGLPPGPSWLATGVGVALLGGYLLFDALTSTAQQSLFRVYGHGVLQQLLWINAAAALLSAGLLVASGAAGPALAFVATHRGLAADAALLATTAVVSQVAINVAIKSYGAVVYTAVMTLRQLGSVVLSNALFGHHLGLAQWASAVVVFAALGYLQSTKAARTRTGGATSR
ncbi:hypothetical protein I4F81_005406 [Pyropia yezoensis]|uniref:Uncharacterized protein n=1 Tax=Pyropia yezoensis TaxID=2788 RepID=A0ACC3BYA7_PYRYE|nr:hypothetical protein I4F81_005406 [Neopyropia yezoensis]